MKELSTILLTSNHIPFQFSSSWCETPLYLDQRNYSAHELHIPRADQGRNRLGTHILQHRSRYRLHPMRVRRTSCHTWGDMVGIPFHPHSSSLQQFEEHGLNRVKGVFVGVQIYLCRTKKTDSFAQYTSSTRGAIVRVGVIPKAVNAINLPICQ